jgi:titin
LDIKWYKNGLEISDDCQNYIKTYNQENGTCNLTILKCTLDDSALYSCRAINSFGMAETNAYLKVKELLKEPEGSPPQIITPLESCQIDSNTNHTLECVISGSPEPLITWFKDDIEIEDSSFKTGKFVNIIQLTINNTQSEKHSGKYTCKAENENGIAETSAVLLVRAPAVKQAISSENQRAPIIQEGLPASFIVKEGQPITLACYFDAYPRVEAIWLRDDKPIDLKLMGLSKDFKVL